MADAGPYTLFDHPLAFHPGKARLALVEKQVPFNSKVINLFNGDSLKPDYLKVNPAGTVPALAAADGRVLCTQSREIVEFVDKLGGAPLGGAGADRKLVASWIAKVDAWDGNLYAAGNAPSAAKLLGSITAFKIKFAEARAKENPELAGTYAKKIAGMKAADAEGRDAAAVEANRRQLAALLDEAEAQLTKTPFLAGSDYSMADVMMTPVIFRTGVAGQTKDLLAPRPKVSDYWDRLKARPSYQKVFGPALSGATAAGLILPAVAKAWLASWTGRY
ncbi:TCHQD class glutathione S-transferase [Raphidocelis subcapitata]|uniref:TCHQD class glutathione S-transferase n=1 Tax=Raphidocelis subcapitata TaxID=307507 RepID=A0A2V0NXB1_9CHLO|nr:TCHQD class glutathione S-transferase [Raphidocelis subcapitata]|eukprot:GBF89455.1 TCHQD class glutathione S-transferase [Raphidocelis subcapitata]